MLRKTRKVGLAVAVAACALHAAAPVLAAGGRENPGVLSSYTPKMGHVIFIHPDGTGLNHWQAARMYWKGPDANLNWDMLPDMAAYRGHMFERMVGTSNGGATTHAFGLKVYGPGSYGADGGDVDGPIVPDLRLINALSGYPGSILREAANTGHPVGVVNDGDAAEPGTGAFLAEVGSRTADTEIANQLINGRPGMDDRDPWVILGGGEGFFLPADTPQCSTEITPDCFVHRDQVTGAGPNRTDGRNLIKEAIAKDYIVLRTRAEFDALMATLQLSLGYAPKVLGLFARDDIFNDTQEEQLIAAGLVDEGMAGTKEGRLILWGSAPGTPGYLPPTAAEMTEMALMILERRSHSVGKPFILVSEIESTDNFGNSNNAIGALQAIKRADEVIRVAQAFQAREPHTLILTAADSDGGAMQVIDNNIFATSEPLDTVGLVSVSANPTGSSAENVINPLDGIEGRNSPPFITEPDAFGVKYPIAIAWPGTPDFAGAIVTRAQGLNAELLREVFWQNFDNTDVYRLMYFTLFGEALPSAIGKMAPDREVTP